MTVVHLMFYLIHKIVVLCFVLKSGSHLEAINVILIDYSL